MEKVDPERKSNFYKFTVTDLILVILILFITVIAVIFAKQDMAGPLSEPAGATVFHGGEVLQRLQLDKDQEIILLDGKMSIEIKERKIRVKKSDCPHQICVHMGWVRYPGETIACVPYNILIEIKSSESPAVDTVIY